MVHGKYHHQSGGFMLLTLPGWISGWFYTINSVWMDKWMNGKTVEEVATEVFHLINP
jgi:hypothetical protein